MPLAIFDLDNTLIAGDSDYSWGAFLVAHKRVDQALYKNMNEQFFADYEAGTLDILAYLAFSLSPLIGMSASDLEPLHSKFMDEIIQPMKLPKASQLIEKHRQAGDRLLVITATNRCIIEPIVRSLGIVEFLSTEPEFVNGRITGQIVGTPTFREGKVQRLNAWLEENHETLSGSYFYSDSINDLPLLSVVDIPVAVDPDNSLRQMAGEQGWDIISLRD
tara:strand:- start:4928 stop:5584 length:657 start_codon:yes stop_codon:yes gene_type:complete